MEQDLQKLTVQHKELQRSYEVLMNFATSAPPTCNLEIEIPEDLRFIDDVPHIDIEIEKLQSHNQQLSLEAEAEQATTTEVETATTDTATARPVIGATSTRQHSPFQREVAKGTPNKAFVRWLSTQNKAQGWQELSLQKRTAAKAAKQSLLQPKASSLPLASPTPPQLVVPGTFSASKFKDRSSGHGMTPETRAMMDRLYVLDPSTLPAPTPRTASPCNPESTQQGLSPNSEAMLDSLLSPSNLPPTPSSGSQPVCLRPLPLAAAAKKAASPATKTLVHSLLHPEAYPTPTQAQADALLLRVPGPQDNLAHTPALTPTAKARSQVLYLDPGLVKQIVSQTECSSWHKNLHRTLGKGIFGQYGFCWSSSYSLGRRHQHARFPGVGTEQANTSKVETAATGSSTARPVFGATRTRKCSPFQREVEKGTPNEAFVRWLSTQNKVYQAMSSLGSVVIRVRCYSKTGTHPYVVADIHTEVQAQGWQELSLQQRTAATTAKQSLLQLKASSLPLASPTPPQLGVSGTFSASKTKDRSSGHGMTPETRAMMDRLYMLDPSTLPAPTPRTASPCKLESTQHGLSPDSEAMLDSLLSPSNLPPTPSSGSQPVCSRPLPLAAAAQEVASPATKTLVHWLLHPEAYSTPIQAQADALLLRVPGTPNDISTPAPAPALTPTAKACSLF
ncbi:hypothetical protein ABBQ38_004846 [Trebouxia sp. C0009 RCD-2024]